MRLPVEALAGGGVRRWEGQPVGLVVIAVQEQVVVRESGCRVDERLGVRPRRRGWTTAPTTTWDPFLHFGGQTADYIKKTEKEVFGMVQGNFTIFSAQSSQQRGRGVHFEKWPNANMAGFGRDLAKKK